MARSALCLNSSTSEGASARLASMNCRICGNNCASFSVAAAMLQNRPMSRFLSCSRRTTCTQRNSSRWSMRGSRPPASAGSRKSAGSSSVPSSVRSRVRPRSSAPCAAAASRSAADRGRRGWRRSRRGRSRSWHAGWAARRPGLLAAGRAAGSPSSGMAAASAPGAAVDGQLQRLGELELVQRRRFRRAA